MKKLFFIKLCLFLLFAQHLFAGDILTIRGYIPEEKIKVGDKVIGEYGLINTITGKELLSQDWFTKTDSKFQWYLINGKYKFFYHQSVFVEKGDYNVCHAFELKNGWTIYTDDGKILTITSIKRITENKGWWRFSINNDHSYWLDGVLVHNAARFWVGGGTNSNWNSSPTTNWSTTSGGANGSATPTSSDDVTLDGAGASGNSNSTCAANPTPCKSLTFTSGYTQTITINNGVALTISGSFTDNTAHSWTVSGTGSLAINATSTITSGGKTFPGPVAFNTGGFTATLSGDWTISGVLTFNNTVTTVNSGTLTCAGLTNSGGSAGTTIILLSGGTWTSTGTTKNSVTLAGNVTVSGTVNWSTGTLLYSSGTITTTGSTLTVGLGSTWNTNGITWNNVSIVSGTQTLNSLLTVTGTLTLSGTSITFAGTSAFTTATLSCTATGVGTLTFKNGLTYTITTAFNAFTSRTGSILLFTSDDGTLTSAITLQNGAICSVLANFTRIDASGGRQINTFHGTLTTTTNIFSYTDYGVGGGSSCLFCN